MFILTDVSSGGIYATTDNYDRKVVHIFEQEEDAQRYITQLAADDYEDDLEDQIADIADVETTMGINIPS